MSEGGTAPNLAAPITYQDLLELADRLEAARVDPMLPFTLRSFVGVRTHTP